ncbi:MAG: amino acid adenylation domain-containing protein, partial [bacterium]|nr:amino acid adenylation domain-containing protein [bacterium]
LFDVMFNLLNQSDHADSPSVSDDTPPITYTHRDAASKFDLNMAVTDRGERLYVSFNYCRKLFKSATIDRMIGYFRKLTLSLPVHPDQRISEVELMTGPEKQQILYQFNAARIPVPRDKSIHRVFEEQAEQTPHHIAVISRNHCLTFDELDRRSNRLARALRETGAAAGDFTGIYLDRCPEMIISMLAILKSGGAYVPLDPEYPRERIAYILADSQVNILLSRGDLAASLDFDGQVIDLDGSGEYGNNNNDDTRRSGDNVHGDNVHGEDAAYLLYTSGSTGKPIGVVNRHQSVVSMALCLNRHYQMTPSERILQFSTISFDASVEQIYISLFSGAGLVLVEKEVLLDGEKFDAFMQRHFITHIHAVPVFLKSLDSGGNYSLKRVISGGDVCLVPVARDWHRRYNFYNKYGPTEATFTATMMPVKHLEDSALHVPIGKPMANATVYILDRWEKPVAIGVVGEMYLGGDGIARGYLNQPELTHEKFDHDFKDWKDGHDFKKRKKESFAKSTVRLYKTGDLACWMPDGNIRFIGRVD